MDKHDKEIRFVLPKSEIVQSEYESKGNVGELLGKFTAGIEEIESWFKQYQIDTIELWISGVVETGNIINLIVSAKGEGGLRVTLKPRTQH
jgi:hypothetical protein